MVHPLLKLRISLHYRLSFMIIFLPIIFLSGPEALKASSDLSPVALFTRCYGQITQTLPAANNPILASVAIGNIDPIEGCLTVLRKGIFAGQNSEQIADATNREALRVVETFHNLHASWFYTKTFPAVSQGTTMTLINDLMDQTQPALYITRALFGPQVRADSIVTLNISLRPIRTTAAPTVGAFSNKTPADLGFNPAPPLAPTGALLGVTGWPASVIDRKSVV